VLLGTLGDLFNGAFIPDDDWQALDSVRLFNAITIEKKSLDVKGPLDVRTEKAHFLQGRSDFEAAFHAKFPNISFKFALKL